MKYFRSKRKKWEELTDKEKLNYLGAIYQEPYFSSTKYFLLVVLGIILIATMFLTIQNNYRLDLLEGTITHEQFDIKTESLMKSVEVALRFINALIVITVAMVVIDIFRYYIWRRKWRPFLDSLKKKEEVLY